MPGIPKIGWLKTFRGLKKGFCPLCGNLTLFILNAPAEQIRNHAQCLYCRSVSRNRHVALSTLKAFADRGITKFSDFGTCQDMRILHTASTGAISRVFGKTPNVTRSEYFDDLKPGEQKDGIICQNLEALTFGDSSFDLIISEDVFEHIQDYKKGFAEVYRVLKPGGCHVFSIPFYFDRKSESLFSHIGGIYRPLGSIEYHGDPLRGQIPVYTRFGYDLLDLLKSQGYSVELEVSRYADSLRFGTFDCYTFITRKQVV